IHLDPTSLHDQNPAHASFVPLATVLSRASRGPNPIRPHILFSIFAAESYILYFDRYTRHAFIALKSSATPSTVLSAWFCAMECAHMDDGAWAGGWSGGHSWEPTRGGEEGTDSAALAGCVKRVARVWPVIEEGLRGEGWDVGTNALETRAGTRFSVVGGEGREKALVEVGEEVWRVWREYERRGEEERKEKGREKWEWWQKWEVEMKEKEKEEKEKKDKERKERKEREKKDKERKGKEVKKDVVWPPLPPWPISWGLGKKSKNSENVVLVQSPIKEIANEAPSEAAASSATSPVSEAGSHTSRPRHRLRKWLSSTFLGSHPPRGREDRDSDASSSRSERPSTEKPSHDVLREKAAMEAAAADRPSSSVLSEKAAMEAAATHKPSSSILSEKAALEAAAAAKPSSSSVLSEKTAMEAAAADKPSSSSAPSEKAALQAAEAAEVAALAAAATAARNHASSSSEPPPPYSELVTKEAVDEGGESSGKTE
ncbi:hypothetical protein V501_04923, partial [Pseudogymnoascus sp. VKM F-4519 (FW-2642)]